MLWSQLNPINSRCTTGCTRALSVVVFGGSMCGGLINADVAWFGGLWTEYYDIQGLVHLNLTSMGFCSIADFLLPRANNLILFMSIQPARNLLGKFVRHWWRHKRSTVKKAKICAQLPSYRLYFRTTKQYQFDISPWLHQHANVSCHRVRKGFDRLTYTL